MTSLLSQLIESLEHLAAEPEVQIAWLKQIGTYPSADELALDLGGWIPALWQLRDSGSLSPDTIDSLKALEERLAGFSGTENASEWHASALAASSKWASVRKEARRILDAIVARG